MSIIRKNVIHVITNMANNERFVSSKGLWKWAGILAKQTDMTYWWLKDQSLLFGKELWMNIYHPVSVTRGSWKYIIHITQLFILIKLWFLSMFSKDYFCPVWFNSHHNAAGDSAAFHGYLLIITEKMELARQRELILPRATALFSPSKPPTMSARGECELGTSFHRL